MDAAIKMKKSFGFFRRNRTIEAKIVSSLAGGKANLPYKVKEIRTEDQDMRDFLFTLGCYQGEEVTIISRLADNLVISIKDARYSINIELAKVIII